MPLYFSLGDKSENSISKKKKVGKKEWTPEMLRQNSDDLVIGTEDDDKESRTPKLQV